MAALRAALRERVRDADGRVGWFAFDGYRVRWHGERFYFLEVAEGFQYLQDVWPETDAMLAVLEGAPRGRVLDVGTGCGIVAIEAAARGHEVVATDLFESALEVARFNARLNQVAIDFRKGHLFEPAGDEKFDLILTAPHYGQIYDQLRCEVLRAGPSCLSATGKLVLATQLEWEEPAEGGARRLGVECLLRPLAEAGMRVEVAPIVAQHKRAWFKFAESDPDHEVPRLVSRARFTVTVEAGTTEPGVSVEWPARDLQPTEVYVPLSRLRAGATHPISAALVDGADVARLGAILTSLGAPDCTLEVPLPSGFLDGCRLGEKPCLGKTGVAAAIVDPEGGVRPCTHAQPLARAGDSEAFVRERLSVLQQEAEARRGCAACPASAMCSRCLATGPLDEAAYCDFIRAHAATLPIFHRLVQTLRHFPAGRPPIRVARWPRAGGSTASDRFARFVERWNAAEAWLVQVELVHAIAFLHDKKLVVTEVDALTFALAERLTTGPAPDELEQVRQELHLPPRIFSRALERLEKFHL